MEEKKSFEEYYLMYANKIYSLAYKMVNNHEDAIDIVQEVFLRAYKNWDNFKGLSKFSTYLYRVAVNLCYDFLRKKKREKKIENLNYENYPFSSNSNSGVEENLMEERIIKEIKNEIDNLTEKQKAVFILKTFEDLKYEEIAKILKKRVGTIKATYFQSLQKIRENLRKKGVIKNEM
ncbi:MAG: RNA polymerase sigma factor [Candidatus Omnitrophica bacterium]|nr:RNA polymerase sigma factor [Candidatus Omnitrophota bacterium]MCM8807358.1 RNA polymerase sigma factor [Candidatus Omnitrophota bacterium]